MSKPFFILFSLFITVIALGGCTTNPATGDNQFTALMSPQQEVQVGAQEHQKIIAQYGLYKDTTLQNYINTIGNRVATNTERADVQYKFFLLDSPVVNAFALPGGYIYITRGLLALANSESEVASVLAHETGHITARHSAERYSRGVVTSLGAMILSSAVGSSGVSEALGVGSDLYMKSYSRGQESQADSLGIRYLNRGGYTTDAMASFLSQLQAESQLQAHIDKKAENNAGYFSTHPATAERVSLTKQEAASYPKGGAVKRNEYLKSIDGVLYGDSPSQGFVRGQNFFHTEMGFKFSVPDGYKIINQPSNIIAQNERNGALIVFDFAQNKQNLSPMTFLKDVWVGESPVSQMEEINVNGMKGATASLQGTLNGRAVQVQLIAIRWSNTQMARFQVILPAALSPADLTALKRATYSFAPLSAQDKNALRPYRIKIIAAKNGDSISSLSARMAQIDSAGDYRDARFRMLNALRAGSVVHAGSLYKIIVE